MEFKWNSMEFQSNSMEFQSNSMESLWIQWNPKEFNGIKLSFLQDDDSTEEHNIYETIPSWFWFGPTYEKVPLNKFYRKRLCESLLK